MIGRMISFAAVAALLLAPARTTRAEVVVLYTEHFVGSVDPQAVSASPIGWTAAGGTDKVKVGTATGWGCTPPPDGDDWWMAKDHWGSSIFALTDEYTVLSDDRRGLLKFLVDWASNNALNGMAFVAEVSGNWYRSEPLCTLAGENGAMPGEYSVSEWVADTTVSETNNWHRWISALPLPDWGSQRTDWDEANPVPLPDGNITGFGIWEEKDGGYLGGGSFRAIDNYRIVVEPPSGGTVLVIR